MTGSHGRRLADFVIAGEMKCGTTSLALHLGHHPEVFVSPTMPVRFFDVEWERGPDWYASQFDGAPDGAVLGDDTPNYLHDRVAVERLAATLPDVRVIVLLREPMARAWSHYWHHDRTGFDQRGFAAAVTHELRHGVGPTGSAEGSGYLSRGDYATSLEHLWSVLPAAQVHVDYFDNLATDPAGVVARAQQFLGVEEVVPDGLDTVYNVGWAPRSHLANRLAFRFRIDRIPLGVGRRLMAANVRPVDRTDISPDLRRRLEEHFAPRRRRLATLLTAQPGSGVHQPAVPSWVTSPTQTDNEP